MAVSAAAFQLGRRRALSVAGGRAGQRNLHSRPVYHGVLTALWCGIPALVLMLLWLALEGTVITGMVVAGLPEQLQALPSDRLGLVVNDIRNTVAGNRFGGEPDRVIVAAAQHYADLQSR